jgi:hypothetical protein
MTRIHCLRLQVRLLSSLDVGINIKTLSAGQNAESAMLVASLRDVIRNQAQEIEALERKVKESSIGGNEVWNAALMRPSFRS